MPNKKEITLVEAQDLYAKNEALREFLESKFSKEELTAAAATSPQEEGEETLEEKFKRVWEEKILTQCNSVRFMDANARQTKTPTSRLQVTDREGLRLFLYDPSGKNKSFWYSYRRVYKLLEKEVSSDVTVLQRLIGSWVEDTLGLQGVVPLCVPREYSI